MTEVLIRRGDDVRNPSFACPARKGQRSQGSISVSAFTFLCDTDLRTSHKCVAPAIHVLDTRGRAGPRVKSLMTKLLPNGEM